MTTPIADFVRAYAESSITRLHMPGHKGVSVLGCESLDITEIAGADSLYEAQGIIAESEANATALFHTGGTIYSTEGSSQCIRAMVYLAATHCKDGERPRFLAGRNAHKAFVYALALVDADVTWLWPDRMDSICACQITAHQVENALLAEKNLPTAVYVTSPDYLGNQLPIAEIAEVCHRYGVLLLVDNAHGAYLAFLQPSQHPMALGADLCCDSAHKTLPVLTGGAYLHMADPMVAQRGKQAMALFGSTSPSYLILESLDLCNAYLAEKFPGELAEAAAQVEKTREALRNNGWEVLPSEPMKLTIACPKKLPGTALAQMLRENAMECEFADEDYLVLMPSAQTSSEDLSQLIAAMGINRWGKPVGASLLPLHAVQAISVRKAIFSPQQTIPVGEALGKIAAAPLVGCPPAIAIVVSGERLDESALRLFAHYGIDRISVIL